MLTTCGLTNAGPACAGDLGILKDVPLGLHGGISNTPADNVCTRVEWRDGRYALTISGRASRSSRALMHHRHRSGQPAPATRVVTPVPSVPIRSRARLRRG